MQKKNCITLLSFIALFLIIHANLVFGRKYTAHPDPGSLAQVIAEHPRIFFNANNIPLLQSRWNDTLFSDLKVNKVGWFITNGSDIDKAVSHAIRYLATDSTSDAQSAISLAEGMLSSGGSSRWGANCDVVALVFDWCYDQLSAAQKTSFITALNSLLSAKITNLESAGTQIRWHEDGCFKLPAPVSMALAVHGEPGANSQLAKAQNIVLNHIQLTEEIKGGGGIRPYKYQAPIHILMPFMWTLATDKDYITTSTFIAGLPRWIAFHLRRNTFHISRSEGDQVTSANGFYWYNEGKIQEPAAMYLIANHFNDPVAQWIGDCHRKHLNWWGSGDYPNWLNFIYYNDFLIAKSPAENNEPLGKHYKGPGFVSMRSGWNFEGDPEQDINAWFYCGYAYNHSSCSQNHFTIWRGDDALAIHGGCYMGQPVQYNDFFHESIARNVLLFTPQGATSPDIEGGAYSINSGNLKNIPNWNVLNGQYYPVADELENDVYTGVQYRGIIKYYNNTPSYLITTGDASPAYGQVDYWLRDLVYIRPDIFIINDRFSNADTLENIRWLMHMKNKPKWIVSETVLAGQSNAGILESASETDYFSGEYGGGHLYVSLVYPEKSIFRARGGSGYESYVDGVNHHRKDFTQEYTWNSGGEEWAGKQWTAEIVVKPDQASGNIVTGIFVCDKGSTIKKPFYSYTIAVGGKDVLVTHGSKAWEIFFPIDTSAYPTISVVAIKEDPHNSESLSSNFKIVGTHYSRYILIMSPFKNSSIEIYDIRGRIIKTFYTYSSPAIPIVWRKDDSYGKPVSSGQYFIQVKSSKKSVVKSIIIMDFGVGP